VRPEHSRNNTINALNSAVSFRVACTRNMMLDFERFEQALKDPSDEGAASIRRQPFRYTELTNHILEESLGRRLASHVLDGHQDHKVGKSFKYDENVSESATLAQQRAQEVDEHALKRLS
jgi:hypothetical protein